MTKTEFWKRVVKLKGRNACWEWVGTRFTEGYGYVYIGGKPLKAHRVAFVMERGSIPEGVFVCHTCDNPPCVRPSHLFLGTSKDNRQDAVKKGRLSGPRNSFYGKRHSAETRRKISEAVRGENSPWFGRRHTEETKAKMRKAMLGPSNKMRGSTHTPEVRSRIAQAMLGNKHRHNFRSK